MYSKYIQLVSAGKSTQELISGNLRFNRLNKGVTQETVANAVSISRPKYNRIEKGRMCPDVITLCNLLVFYDISLEQLLNMSADSDSDSNDSSEKDID